MNHSYKTGRPDWLTFYRGVVYVGDSYGSHSYIDTNEERACPQSCFCWSHDQAPGVFTFIAYKSPSRLAVNIYSDALYSELIQVIGPEKMAEEEIVGHGDAPNSLNGFCLLQSFQNLQAHLNLLGCYAFTDPTLSPVISEMELLVHGFLSDGEAFKSFGYEHLYENGYLTFEQWKAFQQDQLQRDISTLDERFIAMDDSNDFEDFEDSQDPVQLFGIPSEDFEAVETQADGYPMGSSQNAQHCVAEANVIEEAQEHESSHILELSNCEDLSKVQEDTSSQSLCPKEIDSVDAQNGDNSSVGAIDFPSPSTLPSHASQLRTLIQNILSGLEELIELADLIKLIELIELIELTTKEDPTFRRFNKRFIQQYRLMTEAMLDSSADFSQMGTRFKNHREAWNAGISTMRRLCNSKPPRGFQNAIAFLCISRAMSETLDSTNGSDYTSQFLEDLDRWQVLFTSRELEAYRELIHSMWGIVLSENMSKSWKASDFLTLTHFQALLSTFIRQTNEPVNLHGPHDQSLRCSQQNFLARSHQTSAESEVDLRTENLESSDRSNPPPPDSIEPKPPDIPIALEKIPLKEHIENDISAASLDVIVVGLMAGAIFAIVIVFLQCASLTSLSPSLLFC
jgi:hypothetical protein